MAARVSIGFGGEIFVVALRLFLSVDNRLPSTKLWEKNKILNSKFPILNSFSYFWRLNRLIVRVCERADACRRLRENDK